MVNKTKTEKRVCEAEGCTTFLSAFNKTPICATCLDKIPLLDRPYRYFPQY